MFDDAMGRDVAGKISLHRTQHHQRSDQGNEYPRTESRKNRFSVQIAFRYSRESFGGNGRVDHVEKSLSVVAQSVEIDLNFQIDRLIDVVDELTDVVVLHHPFRCALSIGKKNTRYLKTVTVAYAMH